MDGTILWAGVLWEWERKRELSRPFLFLCSITFDAMRPASLICVTMTSLLRWTIYPWTVSHVNIFSHKMLLLGYLRKVASTGTFQMSVNFSYCYVLCFKKWSCINSFLILSKILLGIKLNTFISTKVVTSISTSRTQENFPKSWRGELRKILLIPGHFISQKSVML